MPARSIWKGAISFGMVVIPIKVYAATKSKTIPFVTLHTTCNTRLRHRRWCEYHETFVEMEEVLRGYEYSKDQYVVMEEKDFDGLPVASTHTIDIAQFVSLDSIDPIYFDRTYGLEPETVGQKPYNLLRTALEESRRVAIGRVSIRQKEHICCVRPYENLMVMSTMLHADEIRATDELDLPDEKAELAPEELEMAVTLVDRMTRDFDPNEYGDEYRVALEQRIEAKLGSEEPIVASPTPARGKVVDLMEALRASIDVAKKEEEKRASSPQDAKPSKARSKKQKITA